MGECGLFCSWWYMNGYGLYIYLWVNVVGEVFWVKYYFILY